MAKKLINIYELRVWSDGTIETIEKKLERRGDSINTTEKLNESTRIQGSSRITQILQVIEIALEELKNENDIDEQSVRRTVTKAVKSVADTFEVFETTVRDKINRQIDLSHAEFLEMLIKFHESRGNDDTLKNHLLKYLSNHDFDDDQKLVEESFNKFKRLYE